MKFLFIQSTQTHLVLLVFLLFMKRTIPTDSAGGWTVTSDIDPLFALRPPAPRVSGGTHRLHVRVSNDTQLTLAAAVAKSYNDF